MTIDLETSVYNNIQQLATQFANQREQRVQRDSLHEADFQALAEAGYLLTGVPEAYGGLWRSSQQSTRLYCELVRMLAQADPSLALVSCMHPSVLVFWMVRGTVPEPDNEAWQQQRGQLFDWIINGQHWFGTIASEPGTGGDLLATKAQAERDKNGDYHFSGIKHMGSGSGITSFMVTTAKIAAASEPELFLIDVRDRPWDGSSGMTLMQAWNALGMRATQSHAFKFEQCPVIRCAWPDHALELAPAAVTLASCLFSAVMVGILDAAVTEMRERIAPRIQYLKAYEQVGLTRVENDYWSILQAYEGMLRAVENETEPTVSVNRGKVVIAERAEAVMQQLLHVVGGVSLSKASPLGQWLQDIRALGFLRPPLPLAYEHLFMANRV